jgi:pimeloyl-ACP methyl ester carboxylesterase
MADGRCAYELKALMSGRRRLFYVDEGNGAAVLILHGARSFPGQWDWHIERLVQNGYRVVYPHRAGRLQSDPHQGPLSLAKDARDVVALADNLEIEDFVVVGHSQGACVAQQVLLYRPDRVRGVVSVDSDSFGKLTEVRQMGTDRFDAETLALYKKHEATLTECGRPWEYPSDYNVARVQRAAALQRENPDLYERTTQKPDPDDIPTPAGRYCEVPLLAFAAGRGRIRQDDPEAIALQQRLPSNDARLVVVTASGHGIHEEQPELFSRELLQFLAELGRPDKRTQTDTRA